jgi:hypothetical protein
MGFRGPKALKDRQESAANRQTRVNDSGSFPIHDVNVLAKAVAHDRRN